MRSKLKVSMCCVVWFYQSNRRQLYWSGKTLGPADHDQSSEAEDRFFFFPEELIVKKYTCPFFHLFAAISLSQVQVTWECMWHSTSPHQPNPFKSLSYPIHSIFNHIIQELCWLSLRNLVFVFHFSKSKGIKSAHLINHYSSISNEDEENLSSIMYHNCTICSLSFTTNSNERKK